MNTQDVAFRYVNECSTPVLKGSANQRRATREPASSETATAAKRQGVLLLATHSVTSRPFSCSILIVTNPPIRTSVVPAFLGTATVGVGQETNDSAPQQSGGPATTSGSPRCPASDSWRGFGLRKLQASRCGGVCQGTISGAPRKYVCFSAACSAALTARWSLPTASRALAPNRLARKYAYRASSNRNSGMGPCSFA